MKKLLLTIALLFSPAITLAASYTIPWTATSTSNGLIFPYWNGTYQAIVIPYIYATSTTATSSFAGDLYIGASTGDNKFRITPNRNYSASISVGGAFNITNSSNTGAGMVIYSSNSSPAGRLAVINCDNATFNQTCLRTVQQGTAPALDVVNSNVAKGGQGGKALSITTDSGGGTTASSHAIDVSVTGYGNTNASALNMSSTNGASSAMQISGVETGRGTIKDTHQGSGADGNAAALSIDLQSTSTQTAAQGIFMTSSTGGTTGNLLEIRNGAGSLLSLLANGNLGLSTSSPYSKLSVAGTTTAAVFEATTTATSTFAGAIQTSYLNVTSTTATSTFSQGINLANGCFAINNTCVTGGSGAGTVNSGSFPQIAWYASDGTTLSGTSTDPLTVGSIIATSSKTSKLRAVNITGTAAISGGANFNSSTVTGGIWELNTSAGSIFTAGNGDLVANNIEADGTLGVYGAGSSAVLTLESSIIGPIKATVGADSTNGLVFDMTNLSSGNKTYFKGGNVGIGTSSPYNSLSVLGTTTASVFEATTTATSTFAGAISTNRIQTTSTSTGSNGYNISAGCFSINNVCAGSGSGVSGGTAGMITAWVNSTTLTATGTPTATAYVATSSLATSTFAGAVAIGTTTPKAAFYVKSTGNGEPIAAIEGSNTLSADSFDLFSTSTNKILSITSTTTRTGAPGGSLNFYSNNGLKGVMSVSLDSDENNTSAPAGYITVPSNDRIFFGTSANAPYSLNLSHLGAGGIEGLNIMQANTYNTFASNNQLTSAAGTGSRFNGYYGWEFRGGDGQTDTGTGALIGWGSEPTVVIKAGTVTGSNGVGLGIYGRSGQSADLFQVSNSTPTTLALFNYAGFLGVGSTTPKSLVSIGATSATSTSYLDIASSTQQTVFKVDRAGHQITGGGKPTINSCGSSAVVQGDDNNMKVTGGTGVLTSCVINFYNTWTKSDGSTQISPACVPTDEAGTAAALDSTSTPTTVTVFGGSLTSVQFNLICSASDNFTY